MITFTVKTLSLNSINDNLSLSLYCVCLILFNIKYPLVICCIYLLFQQWVCMGMYCSKTVAVMCSNKASILFCSQLLCIICDNMLIFIKKINNNKKRKRERDKCMKPQKGYGREGGYFSEISKFFIQDFTAFMLNANTATQKFFPSTEITRSARTHTPRFKPRPFQV